MKRYAATTLLMTILILSACTNQPDEIATGSNTGQNSGPIGANENTNTGSTPEDQDCKKCGLILPPIDDHEPPIGSGRGSFYLDIPFIDVPGKKYDMVIAANASGGYFDNTFARTGNPFQYIKRVAVMTEVHNRSNMSDGSVLFEEFDFTQAENVRVKLWRTSNGPADVIIDGANGGSIKTKTPLNTTGQPTGKSNRAKRYVGTTPQPVIKWQIVTTVGNADQVVVRNGINLEASGDDMYQFYFDIHHP